MQDDEARQEVAETRVCVDCGNEFTITQGEAQFYTDRGMSLPKRCKTDRIKKRQMRDALNK